MLPLLLLIPFHGCGKGNGKVKEGLDKGQADSEKKIKEKESKQEPIEVTVVYGHRKPKRSHKVHNRECKGGFYGGLGIYSDSADNCTVIRAVPGYVGAEIGLEPGDVIVSPDSNHLQGEVGSELTLVVKKFSGETKTYSIVRDKICLGDE
jgi:hypothetical protein